MLSPPNTTPGRRTGRQLIFTEIHGAAGSSDGAPVAHAVQTYRIA